MRSRPAGRVRVHLDTYRRLAGYTVAGVCVAIGEEYLRQYGQPYRSAPTAKTGIPAPTWYAWTRGRMPHTELIGPITRVLGATRQELWAYAGEYTPPAAPSPPAIEEAMDRRHLLILGALGATAPLHAAPDPGEELETRLDHLAQGGVRVPAVTLLAQARASLAAVRGWQPQGPRDRRERDRLTGKAAILVAWLAAASLQPALAAGSFALAERAARLAGDQPLAACAATRLGLLAARTGDPVYGGTRAAFAHLARAERYVPGGRSIVAARTASVAVRLHARMGNRQEATASLRMVDRVMTRATDQASRRGLFGFAPRQYHDLQAVVENAFGNPRQALDHAAHAVAMSPRGELVDRNLFVLEQATAHRRLGDAEAAAIVAEPVLAVPVDASTGILTARLDRFVREDLAGVNQRRAVAFRSAYSQQHRAIRDA